MLSQRMQHHNRLQVLDDFFEFHKKLHINEVKPVRLEHKKLDPLNVSDVYNKIALKKSGLSINFNHLHADLNISSQESIGPFILTRNSEPKLPDVQSNLHDF